MKLIKIDPRPNTEQTTPPQSAGLKVKSHVKAGLADVRAVAICG